MFEFKRMREENLEMVLNWRLKPFVKHYLFTDVENNLEKQKNWFKKISTNPTYRYWVIFMSGIPIGLVNLANLDFFNKRTNASYYIGEEKFLQFGGVVLPYFYNHIFLELGINKVHGEVIEGNPILKIHLMHGYRLVGTMKDHVYKNDQLNNIHIVELMKDDWIKNKRFSSYIAKFE